MMRIICIALALIALVTREAVASAPYALAHHPVSTPNAQAQHCFDRGLTLFYAYNRVAARQAFGCAAAADPKLAMAFWGIALSLGSNINFTVDAAGEKSAFDAVRHAEALAAGASGNERAHIRALAVRYSGAANPDLDKLARAYYAAMRQLTRQYPDDLDAATLFAESAMELRPWQLYTPAGLPVPGTAQIGTTLESVLAREPNHIGANHFYIHAVEASLHPERARMSAGRLRGMNFEAGAAHLVHMPAHIYMRTGDFQSAALVNEHASAHDVAFMRAEAARDTEASAYHDHNLTMLAAAYSSSGRFADARRVAALLRSDGAWIPATFVFLRFNRWNDILTMPKPKPDTNEPLRGAVWHFARGMAFANLRKTAQAEGEAQALYMAHVGLSGQALPGTYNAPTHLWAIMHDVLGAKISATSGDRDVEIKRLRSAVGTQDNFLYVEPPDWYFPVREALGAALIRAGQFAKAEQTFREDLSRNPGNARSLYGLYRSLRAQGRSANARLVLARFHDAWKTADTAIGAAVW